MTTLTIQSGPRNARTDPDSGLRYYRWLANEYPSVTTVRRMAGLPHGLHQWAIGQVATYAVGHASEIAGRIAAAEDTDAAGAIIRQELRKAATAERDAAARLGTAVHDAAALGKALEDVPPELRPRLRQYQDWLRASGAEILGAEFQCWNPTVGYAGTADLLVRLRDGAVWLVDLKTGKGVYGEHSLQLMAYLMAEFVGSDDVVDDRLTALLKEAVGMAVLHLSDTGWEFRALRPDSGTWDAFRGLLQFAVWMAGHDKADSVTVAKRSGEAAA